jgi:hypothetical protein
MKRPHCFPPLTNSNIWDFPETAFRFPHLIFVSVGAWRMPDEEQPESPAFYREKAAEALRQSQEVTSNEARLQLLALAEHWRRLAEAAEHQSR